MGKLGPYDLNTIVTSDARELTADLFPCKFGVIIADPPWSYRQGATGRLKGAASKEYDTMTDDDIINMPVYDLAKDDSVLFLWGTWPKADIVMQVLKAWDFEYLTGLPWIKLVSRNGGIQGGVGHWLRGVTEFIYIGKRGNVRPPIPSERYAGLLAENLKHSRKPDDIHDIAEKLPGPWLELFARRTRPNWYVFGNDIDTNGAQLALPNIEPQQLRLGDG